MTKKAMSPLISTIVLIVFAGALGAAVISWGNSEADNFLSEKGCEDVSLAFVKINDISQICQNGDEIEFMVHNNGEVIINGLRVILIGDDQISRSNLESPIIVGDVIQGKVITDSIGNIKKVMLIPVILTNNQEKICSKTAIEVDNLLRC